MSMVKAKRRAGRPRGSVPHAVRDALLSAARKILSENVGSQMLTLTHVAHLAGVNPAMVNYHFGSKSELISALIREALSESLRRIGGIGLSDDTPDVKLRRRVRSAIELYRDHPYISRLLKEQVFYSDGEARAAYLQSFFPETLNATKNILDEGTAAGSFREVDHFLFWTALIGICEFYFMVRPIFRSPVRRGKRDGEDLDTFVDFTTEILLHGITLPGAAPQAIRGQNSETMIEGKKAKNKKVYGVGKRVAKTRSAPRLAKGLGSASRSTAGKKAK